MDENGNDIGVYKSSSRISRNEPLSFRSEFESKGYYTSRRNVEK